jgi:hypothetical protein
LSLLDGPVSFVNTFIKVLVEVLEEVDADRVFAIDMAVIFENQPRDMQDYVCVFCMPSPRFKISCVKN